MANIHHLKIKNFKGIQEFDHTFNNSNFIALVGRGDSGKTTILEAIEYALYPNWNLQLNDSDFFNCDSSQSIEIEVTLRSLDSDLLTQQKYGLFIRSLEADGKINTEVKSGQEELLTVLFKVEKDLEPKWFITSHRIHQEDIKFEASDRAKLNVFSLSYHLDRHFSWSKGTPLYSLYKQSAKNPGDTTMLDATRTLKNTIDLTGFKHLDDSTERIKSSALKYGINIHQINTGVDVKDLMIKDSKIILHDDKVPFKLKGKGSKRLISAAIQTELAKSGILLIDEIEQGLEPDRLKNLIRTLLCEKGEQTFFTTHSQHVIEELDANNIFIVNNTNGKVTISTPNEIDAEKYRSLFRTCPEALYANKVIVCEGKTEIGICRVIDKQRVTDGLPSLSARGVVYTLGGGDGFNSKAEILQKIGKEVSIFCDSDKDHDLKKPTKTQLTEMGVKIFDLETGNNMEKQLSLDLPWDGLLELTEYVLKIKNVNTDFKTFLKTTRGSDWTNMDSEENRKAFFEGSSHKNTKGEVISWFKTIRDGEALGDILNQYKGKMKDGTKLKELLTEINTWI